MRSILVTTAHRGYRRGSETVVYPAPVAIPRYTHTCADCGARYTEDEPERYKGLCFTCARYEFE